MINKLTVEHLIAYHWDPRFNELINLKSLNVCRGWPEEMGHFEQLELVTVADLDANSTSLRRMFENSGKLVSLTLQDADEVMPTIFKFGLNLRKLGLSIKNGSMFDNYSFWQDIAKMTKLRRLSIDEHYYFSDDTLNLNVKGFGGNYYRSSKGTDSKGYG